MIRVLKKIETEEKNEKDLLVFVHVVDFIR